MLLQSRRRSSHKSGAILTLVLAATLLLAAAMLASRSAGASSHREAPLISKDAFADNTDTYVFIAPNDPSRIVLYASWIPFEGPEGGPNYWEWDDNVRYNIYVDVNGDAVKDVTYELSSQVIVNNPNTFLYNTNTIDSLSDPDWNRTQVYTVTESFADGMEPPGSAGTHILVNGKSAAPVNIGDKSTPDYWKIAKDAIYSYTDPGNGDAVSIYAGQTDDPFFVDLQVFDLLTLRGQAPPIGYANNNRPVDSVSGFNNHSLIIEVPIDRLVRNGEPVLGVWAGSERATMSVMGEGSASYAQVSRLGMPLVNELVLPMGLKDTFNSIAPSVDLTIYGLLQESVEDPEVGNLLCALYGVPLPEDSDDDCDTEYIAGVPRTGRGDIFDIFLTGMVLANPFTIQTADGPVTLPAGFNVNQPAGVVPAEMIRINTTISGDLCSPTPNRLGVLAGDACGFPNGRRLFDDVVDIELMAVAGAAYELLDDQDASFTFDPALVSVLTDRVDSNDRPFLNQFPWGWMPASGQKHFHENQVGPIPLALNLAPWLGVAAIVIGPMALAPRWLKRRRK